MSKSSLGIPVSDSSQLQMEHREIPSIDLTSRSAPINEASSLQIEAQEVKNVELTSSSETFRMFSSYLEALQERFGHRLPRPNGAFNIFSQQREPQEMFSLPLPRPNGAFNMFSQQREPQEMFCLPLPGPSVTAHQFSVQHRETKKMFNLSLPGPSGNVRHFSDQQRETPKKLVLHLPGPSVTAHQFSVQHRKTKKMLNLSLPGPSGTVHHFSKLQREPHKLILHFPGPSRTACQFFSQQRGPQEELSLHTDPENVTWIKKEPWNTEFEQQPSNDSSDADLVASEVSSFSRSGPSEGHYSFTMEESKESPRQIPSTFIDVRSSSGVKDSDNYKLSCNQCQFSTGSVHVLRCHIMAKHQLIMPVHCPHCRYFPKNRGLLKRHIEVFHNSQKTFSDNNYNNITSNNRLPKKCAKKPTKKQFACPGCQFSTKKGRSLLNHITDKHSKRKCIPSPHSDDNNTVLNKHITSKTKNKCPKFQFNEPWGKTVRKSLFCSHCSYSTVKPNKLNRHISTMHKGAFACPHCNYVGKFSSALQAHCAAKHSHS